MDDQSRRSGPGRGSGQQPRTQRYQCGRKCAETQQVTKREVQFSYAIDGNGRVLPAEDAPRDEAYTCPECHKPLVLKRGDVLRPHFAHHPEDQHSGETYLHYVAKHLIAQAVRESRGRSSRPRVIRSCPVCAGVMEQELPVTVRDAKVECRLPSGFVLDVGLFEGFALIGGVEVLCTHRVDEGKAAALEVPFYELRAEDILQDSLIWRPVRDRGAESVCSPCMHRVARYEKAMRQIGEFSRQPKPSGGLIAVPHLCASCTGPMLLYWHDSWPARDRRFSKGGAPGFLRAIEVDRKFEPLCPRSECGRFERDPKFFERAFAPLRRLSAKASRQVQRATLAYSPECRRRIVRAMDWIEGREGPLSNYRPFGG
ncbi:competence protein CoiA family protein [Rohdeia mirabilis]|uniref:competence protein CoiA family protein n=1 Tax=Rohdeia mirabilis TaxID=2528008 RepID=UPI003AF36EF0